MPLLTPALSSCSKEHYRHDVGSEELGHLEMVGTLVHQLTKGISCDEVKKSGFSDYYVDHSTAVYPTSASGSPWTAASIQSTGDPIADLTENLAAEQKARLTYDNILRLSDDADVNEVIRFLRAREVVHFQRFGEALRSVQDMQDCKKTFAMPSPCDCSPF